MGVTYYQNCLYQDVHLRIVLKANAEDAYGTQASKSKRTHGTNTGINLLRQDRGSFVQQRERGHS